MRLDEVLKRLLAEEFCAAFSHWTQLHASGMLRISQGDVSLIRRGKLRGISASRLLRCLVRGGYNVEVRLAASPDRYRKGSSWPSVVVVRLDRYGREVGRRSERAR